MATTPRSDALTTRYQASLSALSFRSGQMVGSSWDAVEGIDDDAAERFAARAAPVSEAAQRRMVALSSAYVAAYLTMETGVPRRPLDLAVVVRNGVDPVELWKRSIVTARAAIARGRDYAAARAEGRARAVATARTNVALAARAASGAAMKSYEVARYRRVLGMAPCALCVSAAAKDYASSTLMPIHGGCSCGIEPQVETRRRAIPRPIPAVNDSPEVTAMVADGLQVAKVVEHDELGPLLWQAGHAFASLT